MDRSCFNSVDIRRMPIRFFRKEGCLGGRCTFGYLSLIHILGKIVSQVPFYHLACLPDREAVELSCRTLFAENDEAVAK